MTGDVTDRHALLSRLFSELCDRDSAERARSVAEIGQDDPELARELAELLELDAADVALPVMSRLGGDARKGRHQAVEERPAPEPPAREHGAMPTSERYAIVRQLGEGGLGVVYEAYDRERGEHVALKTFKRPDSDAIFRLKREFRSLAGIRHPHLVALYDLVVSPGEAFYTMELIGGVDALTYARGDEARLRRMLPQLALGLSALHAMGKLHRDVKPSNVLVTREGRAVLLDFGLAVDIERLEDESVSHAVVGTFAYMSPEQARAERDLGPATDWYAFGVLLYEALTGARPFSGSPIELLAKKTQRVAPPPRQLDPSVPGDLDALARDLLERDPERRMRGDAVLEALGVPAEAEPARGAGDSAPSSEPEVTGREAEIEALFRALDEVQQTREARAVCLSGPSGIGKSAIAREFLRRLRRRGREPVILRGRCYESEAVSYRAMDNVIDELSRFWRGLSELEAGFLCPQEPHLLPVLFPVLGRVAAIAGRRSHDAPVDPQERRDRAYAALRETFRKLAADWPVVIELDDMQWVDEESAGLLAQLLLPPHAPAVLLVVGARSAGGGDAQLSRLLRRLGGAAEVREVPPLSAPEAEAVAARLVGEAGELPARIAREAEGNPFFLLELSRAVLSGAAPPGRVSVETLLRARVRELSADERATLEVVAVAGEPVGEEVAETAARLPRHGFAQALRTLRAVSLLRTASGRRDRVIECFHDRVAQAVLREIDRERLREVHEALAAALELSPGARAEALAYHWQAAGHPAVAARWARRAADDARATLDFSGAADLLALALSLGSHDDAERGRLLAEHGDALVQAGRPAEAAQVLERAIALAPAGSELDLRGRVAQLYFALGELPRGLDAAAELARRVGWRFPRSKWASLWRAVFDGARLRVAGDDPPPRRAPRDERRLRARIEIARGLARSLSLIDPLRGAACGHRAARDVLALDDAELRAQILAMRAVSAVARADRKVADRQIARASELAAAAGSPVAAGYVAYARGFYGLSITQDWPRVVADLERSLQCFRDAGRGEGYELDSVVIALLTARVFYGELRELRDTIPQMALQYARSGRRFLEVTVRTRHALLPVLADAPDEAIADVQDALASWPDVRGGYLLQHFHALITTAQADLYRDRPREAKRRVSADARALRRSLLTRVGVLDMDLAFLRGRIELSLAAAEPAEARAGRRRALACARALARTKRPLAVASATLLRAGAANLIGDRESAIRLLEHARGALEATQTRGLEACVNYRLGELVGGDEGASLVAAAELWMARQDIASPARTTALFLPGWPHPDRADRPSSAAGAG